MERVKTVHRREAAVEPVEIVTKFSRDDLTRAALPRTGEPNESARFQTNLSGLRTRPCDY